MSDMELRFDVDLAALARTEKALAAAPQILKEEIKKAVRDILLYIETVAKELCPTDTGLLRKTTNAHILSWFSGVVGTNTVYAADVEYGTRPHKIVAKNKPYLKFYFSETRTKSKGGRTLKNPVTTKKWIQVKSVNHPGTRPQPFMEPAFLKGREYAVKRLNEALEAAIARVNKEAT